MDTLIITTPAGSLIALPVSSILEALVFPQFVYDPHETTYERSLRWQAEHRKLFEAQEQFILNAAASAYIRAHDAPSKSLKHETEEVLSRLVFDGRLQYATIRINKRALKVEYAYTTNSKERRLTIHGYRNPSSL